MRGKGGNSAIQLYILGGLALLFAGCDRPSVPEAGGRAAPTTERQQGSGESSRSSFRQKQAVFLNEIRQADPAYRTIEKAILNENNELGLVLSRNIPMDSIPALMRSLLTKMAKEFPGQDLTIVAYGPSNPPMEIGTARFDARTRQMSYTPSQTSRI